MDPHAACRPRRGAPVFLLAFLTTTACAAMAAEEVAAPPPLVRLYDAPYSSFFRVQAPPELELLKGGLLLKAATFTVNYLPAGPGTFGDTCVAWPDSAKAAFSFAASIWAAKLNSAVPIAIDACWASNMAAGVLGHAGARTSYRNFPNAPLADTWYTVAVANSLAGTDLNTTQAEVYAGFSNVYNWYLGTDGNTPAGQKDFVTVVLHEIGHGLGFAGSMDVSGGSGSWGSGSPSPYTYDRFVENAAGQSLINTSLFANPSTALAIQLQSNALYFDATNATAANGGNRVPLYAPAVWDDGSSYSHLAESFNNTADALMTFSLPNAEAIHNPGPVTLGIMRDIGWAVSNGGPPTLVVNKAGAGSGTVTSSPAGINCGATCIASYAPGVTVTLTASPTPATPFFAGSIFAGWSGACSGMGPCTVTMSAAKTVTAAFTEVVSVTVARIGTGSGTLTSPAGIDCGTTCNSVVPVGTTVILTPSAAPGSFFAYWQGRCPGFSPTCAINTLRTNPTENVSAAFLLLAHPLTVTKAGTGSGTITSTSTAPFLGAQQPSINCGTTCTQNLDASTGTSLWYVPAPGSVFAGWGGACTGRVGSQGECNLSVTAPTSVVAHFKTGTASQSPLTVVKTGNWNGTVTSSIAGINCGSTCAANFTTGATIVLTATPDPSFVVFVSPPAWSGGGCPATGNTCTVPLSAAALVTVAFNSFDTHGRRITVNKAGTGAGTVAGGSQSCAPAQASCSFGFNLGTTATLTASPSAGSTFGGWSGACSGMGTCTFSVTADATVHATFHPATGTLTASPAALDFSSQSMQTTSPPQAVTITNSSGFQQSFVISMPPGFSVSHNCPPFGGGVFAPGAQCTANVTFTPIAQGAASGVINIVSTGAGRSLVTLSGTGERSLVTHYYRAILNRSPDASGKAFWEGEFARLGALGSNPNESWFLMANYFFNSPEYIAAGKTNTAFMIDVYNTFFNRPPDQGGFDFWMSQMNAGLSREGLIFWFMFSPEFRTFTQGIFGSTAARPEVDMVMDFFRGILNRFPDTAAFNAFVGTLRSAQCQAPAARAGAVYTGANDISYFFLFGSAEYANRARTNTQFVSDMYNAFLRRGGTATEVAFWINQLNTGAKDRNRVRADFIASPEFAARVNAVINAGCVQ